MLREKYPGVWYKIHGGPYQEAGIPDIIGCYKGYFIAFEVKRPNKRSNVSVRQGYQIDRLDREGAFVGVITSTQEAKKAMTLFKLQHEELEKP